MLLKNKKATVVRSIFRCFHLDGKYLLSVLSQNLLRLYPASFGDNVQSPNLRILVKCKACVNDVLCSPLTAKVPFNFQSLASGDQACLTIHSPQCPVLGSDPAVGGIALTIMSLF